MLAIGLMSGTSLDGIDAVLCDIQSTEAGPQFKQLDFLTLDMPEAIKTKIRAAISDAHSSSRLLCSLNFELGHLFSEAVKRLLHRNQLNAKEVSFIANHGQTIYHLPNPAESEVASTLQLGESSIIAYDHRIQVIDNFRVMDMAAGGEGAPLVPFSEHLLYRQKGQHIALQNIGGIGNITYLFEDQVIAFDTGPGNMMIDTAMKHFYHVNYDDLGQVASKGNIAQDVLSELMNHPYLNKVPPKSTGRELFGDQAVLTLIQNYPNVLAPDFIRTLTYFTAYCIQRSCAFLPHPLDQLIVGGGGAHNLTLMKDIQGLLKDVKVMTQEEIGFSSDAKEAMAFVVLGYHTLNHLPSNVPSATGAKRPVVLGKITPIPY